MAIQLLKHPLVSILVIAMAIAIVVIQIKNKPGVQHNGSDGIPPVSAVYIRLESQPYQARATAYGYVEPARVLNAKTEVSGRITYVHPDLKKGGTIAADTLVMSIETATLERNLDQSRASLQASESALEQLLVEKKSTERQREIALKNLEVGQTELERVKTIFERNLVAKSAVDAEEQKVLSLAQQLEDVAGRLAAFDSREASLKADIERSTSLVSQSQDTLGRTEITLPFDARIGTVSAEQGEYVTAGNSLFEALGMEAAEITAELPMTRFRPLIAGFSGNRPSVLNVQRLARVAEQLNLDARVSLIGESDELAEWTGQLKRISESVDPTRSTIGLVVHVDRPYDNIIPGQRPPLVKGMYTAIEFTAPAADAWIIPRNALHQGRVYVADENDQLVIKPVEVNYLQGEDAVLKQDQSAIRVGDRIIVSDLIPVIPGMPLRLSELDLDGEMPLSEAPEVGQ